MRRIEGDCRTRAFAARYCRLSVTAASAALSLCRLGFDAAKRNQRQPTTRRASAADSHPARSHRRGAVTPQPFAGGACGRRRALLSSRSSSTVRLWLLAIE